MEGNDRTKTTPDLEDTNRVRLKSNEEKGQAVLGRFIEQSNQNNSEERKHVLSDLNRSAEHVHKLTEEEFNETLRRRGKDTAPGPDRIRYSDIKNLTESPWARYRNPSRGINEVLNKTFHKCYISEDWTDIFLRPILKPGKDRHMHKLNG